MVHKVFKSVHGRRWQSQENIDALPLIPMRKKEDNFLLRESDGAGHNGLSPPEIGGVEGEAGPGGDEERCGEGRSRPAHLEVVHC